MIDAGLPSQCTENMDPDPNLLTQIWNLKKRETNNEK